MIRFTPDLHSSELEAHALEAPPEALVSSLGGPLQGQAMLDPLDGPGDGWRDALDAPLDGVPEKGDVALPTGRPLHRLLGQALLGTRRHQVEGRKAGDAGGAHAPDLGPGGGGNADGHVGAE